MNKKTYFLPLLAAAALQLASCSDNESGIFEESAAERLENGRTEVKNTLCAEGGLWELQYFSNSEEPGYVFTCLFKPDGSVVLSTDHDWIGGEFKQEKSLWQIISDNGNVLTFNSYNTLFHIFSDPENIVGPLAPTNDGKDINEQGYGHNGDYEFQVMEHTNDRIRLLGKKRGITAWLTRLPAETDPATYLGEIKALRAKFPTKFPTLWLTDLTTGLIHDVSGMSSGVVTLVPYLSDSPNSRSVTANGIITHSGFRFMKPVTVVREDDSVFKLTEFTWAEDGSLVSNDVEGHPMRLAAQGPAINLQNVRLTWNFDKTSFSPALLEAHDAASAALQASAGAKFDLRAITFAYFANQGKTSFAITLYAGTRLCRDFATLEVNPEMTAATITLTDANKASADFDKAVPEYTAFKHLLAGEFTLTPGDVFNPSTIIFESVTNPGISFSVKVK